MAKFQFIFVALVAGLAFVWAQAEEKPLPCGATVRCSQVEDPVWVTDGKKCYVYRNPCLLSIAQCERERANLEEYKVICKEDCQKLCDPNCPKGGKPVCAEFVAGNKEFPNQCELDYYACSTGNTYVNLREGPCE